MVGDCAFQLTAVREDDAAIRIRSGEVAACKSTCLDRVVAGSHVHEPQPVRRGSITRFCITGSEYRCRAARVDRRAGDEEAQDEEGTHAPSPSLLGPNHNAAAASLYHQF